MYIKREISPLLSERMFGGKAIVLIGARQVGKSTLLRHLVDGREEKLLELNCDDPDVRAMLAGANMSTLRILTGDAKIVFIDEAQRVDNIGIVLKMMVDNMPSVQLLVSGSSSLDLRNRLDEPLTGRKYEYYLYPLSVKECYDAFGLVGLRQNLYRRIIYGSYPDVVTHADNARELLVNLADSYLYKDLLSFDSVRRPELLDKLLIALALQVGSEVSYNELAKTVGIDAKTVEKYIGLLEKCFVIFRLGAFSRNPRNEIQKSRKIYFYDTGVRNAIIRNFATVDLRDDMGALWENYFIAERVKYNHYRGRFAMSFFWRTINGAEVDYVEIEDGHVKGFELKWNPRKASVKAPRFFTESYGDDFNVITPDNYVEFLM